MLIKILEVNMFVNPTKFSRNAFHIIHFMLFQWTKFNFAGFICQIRIFPCLISRALIINRLIFVSFSGKIHISIFYFFKAYFTFRTIFNHSANCPILSYFLDLITKAKSTPMYQFCLNSYAIATDGKDSRSI